MRSLAEIRARLPKTAIFTGQIQHAMIAALLTNSWNALVLALFQHAYVWVHMYCTEDPDMRILYGAEPNDTPAPEQSRS